MIKNKLIKNIVGIFLIAMTLTSCVGSKPQINTNINQTALHRGEINDIVRIKINNYRITNEPSELASPIIIIDLAITNISNDAFKFDDMIDLKAFLSGHKFSELKLPKMLVPNSEKFMNGGVDIKPGETIHVERGFMLSLENRGWDHSEDLDLFLVAKIKGSDSKNQIQLHLNIKAKNSC